MGQLRHNFYSLSLIAILLSTGACVPQKSSSSSSSKGTTADSLALTTVRVGAGAAYNAETYSGNYYSKYDPVVVNGTCKGNVQKIQVTDTPTAGATTSQTVACSNGTFSWTKSLTTETTYALVITPQDSSGVTISGVSPISKNYTYDITNPLAPTYTSPSVTNNFTITNGVTSVTIAGQVLNEVVKMIGPYSLNIPLIPDPDGIHKNFAFNAPVQAELHILKSLHAPLPARQSQPVQQALHAQV